MSEKNKKGTPVYIYFLTPFFIFMLCASIGLTFGITPYNKVITYVNLVFSDKMKNTVPASESIVVSGEINKFENEGNKTESNIGTVIYPSFGEQYAMLSCASKELYVPVYWGSSSVLLESGACQLTSSSVIGEIGNVVIDAHVNTFFANLDKLEEGDEVVLRTSYGQFTYKVTKQVEFSKTDKKYISRSKDDKLTLYTCVKQILGSSDQRLAVICEPVEKLFYNN